MTTENKSTEQILGKVRELAEKMEKGLVTTEEKQLLGSLNEKLDDLEETNQKNTQSLHEANEQALEQKQRIEDLENELINGRSGHSVDFKNTDAYKALNEFCSKGDKALFELKDDSLLRSDNEISGGVLTTTEVANEIIKPITETSPIRQYARVRTIGSKSLVMPVRKGLLDAAWEGEAEQDEISTSNYGSETITPFRLSVTVPVTMDQLMDSAFDMNAEIMSDANERFAQKEGEGFVKGTGHKMPTGFLVDSRITSNAFETEASGAIKGDDVIKLHGEVKTGYNLMYTFNRRSLAYLRTLKGSDGQYLWQPGLNGGAANTISGVPYFLSEDMPDIANNALAIMCADFRRGYQIIDRTALSVVRDDVTRKRNAIVEFTIHRWLTGQPVLPEAFKVMRVKN